MVRDIKIADFSYPLPDERIARHPLAKRDACRLVVSDPSGEVRHMHFSDLPELLDRDSLMICNETRVINARVQFHKTTGARIEVFLLAPVEPEDYVLTFQTRGRCVWNCMVGNLKKWKDEPLHKELHIPGEAEPVILTARRLGAGEGTSHNIEFTWDNDRVTFASIVEAAGYIPIPPYLQRASEESDADDYQTVYSRVSGSVAAPTAGLHFTPELFGLLHQHGVEVEKVTLHVGAGTFQPVKSEAIGDHPMHTETFSVERHVIADVRNALMAGRPVVAVGTTSVRTLESLPVLGALLCLADRRGEPVSSGEAQLHVGQWDAYSDEVCAVDTADALARLLLWMDTHGMETLTASTAIMIAPSFKWRIVTRMVTNFHQPESTLLLLVSSFLDGDADPASDTLQWKRIYREALDRDYRFLSYGDACLLSPRECQIHLPGSKSISARALVARFLGDGDCDLVALSPCADTRDMQRTLSAVRSSIDAPSLVEVNVGEGGTTLRFAMAAAAAVPGVDVVLYGSGRLPSRPILPLIEALRSSGACIEECAASDGTPGWHIRGTRLPGGEYTVDGSVSSQFISAILLSAPVRSEEFCLFIPQDAVSLPYIEMTLGVMREMGAGFEGSPGEGCVRVSPCGYHLPARMTVEPDWSAASYFFEMRALLESIGRPVEKMSFNPGLAPISKQGDAQVVKLYGEFVSILRSSGSDAADCDKNRKVWEVDFTTCPDLVPAMAVMACGCGVKFRFTGVSNLRVKECDRLNALCIELARLGYILSECEDMLEWDGSRSGSESDAVISAHGDHRIAMALGPMAAVCGEIVIDGADTVGKSFPHYWEELAKVGFCVTRDGNRVKVRFAK